jgi:hypothetical protein
VVGSHRIVRGKESAFSSLVPPTITGIRQVRRRRIERVMRQIMAFDDRSKPIAVEQPEPYWRQLEVSYQGFSTGVPGAGFMLTWVYFDQG